jgi:hypothetical protein
MPKLPTPVTKPVPIDTSLKSVAGKAQPLWRGPEVDGVTCSLLSKFLANRAHFKCLVIDGWKIKEGFSHRTSYGSMWHICEDAHAAGRDWRTPLKLYASTLIAKYPIQQVEIEHWYVVCSIQFPIYIEYCSRHLEMVRRTPIEGFQEKEFAVPYPLPSGRIVMLRGKIDAADLVIGDAEYPDGEWVCEHKSKGDIDTVAIHRQLRYDAQTLIYSIALKELRKGSKYDVIGTRYNVIRRPLSGGKGTIRQHQPSKKNPQGESKDDYYNRVQQVILEDQDNFFMRWKVRLTDQDRRRFQVQTLDPILEQLCWWYDAATGKPPSSTFNWEHLVRSLNYRHPAGVWNPTDNGRSTAYDDYLDTGSTLGLEKVTNLYPELSR